MIGNGPCRCVLCGWRGRPKTGLDAAKWVLAFVFFVLVGLGVALSAYYVWMDYALSYRETEMKKIMGKQKPGPGAPLKKNLPDEKKEKTDSF